MNSYDKMKILGEALSEGRTEDIVPLIAENCYYESSYSGKTLSGVKNILSYIQSVYSNTNDTCSYTYTIISLETILSKGMDFQDLKQQDGMYICSYGLLLYQYGTKNPVAVIVCMINSEEKFCSIQLSRDKSKFNVHFFGEEIEDDSPNDLPCTVKPFQKNGCWEESTDLSPQKAQTKKYDRLYIWQKADEYIKQWLPRKGYTVLKSVIFKDCIGYRCKRNDWDYTVFMYAYGKRKTFQLSGDSCHWLAGHSFAKQSIVLILCLNVHRYMDGSGIKYRIRNYCGDDQYEPELWKLDKMNGKPFLQYYPCQERTDRLWQLMYAFNREATDIYDCIIVDENPSFKNNTICDMQFKNTEFYHILHEIHQKYGNMKLGYVRFHDSVYIAVPYIENFGFFDFNIDTFTNRIFEISAYPFDGGEKKVSEFIKTKRREPYDLFHNIPKLIKAVPLTPVPTERFSVKLLFDNGECRKYVLPVESETEKQDSIYYMDYCFTDEIWASVSVVEQHQSRYLDYPGCGPAIRFDNQFLIAGTRCYLESEAYSEPEFTDEIVYSDDKNQIRKLWKWNAGFLHEDKETGLIQVLLSGHAFNWYGKSVFASVEGERMTSLTFDITEKFNENLACVGIRGYGYGFVDKNMNFTVPMRYDEANDFLNGKALVRLDKVWYCIDKEGRELKIAPKDGSNYQKVVGYVDGMCRISSLKIGKEDLAYYSENEAGIWGFVDETGEAVIAPQYIYAYDFEDGIAIVAKGKWTIDPKWDNLYNQGCYWTEEELWGGIDKSGKEVIPFIFDEIKFFNDCNEVYMAHYGGWQNGSWGVIDRSGKWLAEPIFKDIDYIYHDGLFAFYEEKPGENRKDSLMGIYDIREKKVLFKPQFSDIDFEKNGDIMVEIFDGMLGRRVCKLIDRTGKERFESIYSSIYTLRTPYEVTIKEESGSKRGLIDEKGNVILPCVYDDVPWDGFHHEYHMMLFETNGKKGIRDYNGNVIIPAIYLEIYGWGDPFLTVRIGDKNNYREGLITFTGKQVVLAEYKHIEWCRDKKHFFCCLDDVCEMYRIEEI